MNHPDLIKTVLKETHKHFDKRSLAYSQFRKAFGTGLVISEGDLWRSQRRLMQPHFSPSALRTTFDAMADCVARSSERLEARVKNDVTFNMVSEMHALTLDIAGSTLLGTDFAAAQQDIARWTHNINAAMTRCQRAAPSGPKRMKRASPYSRTSTLDHACESR